MTLQQTVGNQAVLRLLAGSRLQTKLKVSHPSDAHEKEADWIAERLVRGRSEFAVQRKCAHCAVSAPCNECAEEEEVQRKVRGQSPASGSAIIQRAANNTEKTSARTPETVSASASRLIVEDDTRQLVAGQMHKSQFLALLRDHVCTTADEALARVGRTTKGCPYIERWLTHYADKDSQYIERALRRYAPEAAGARAARDYIPAVSGRVRRGVEIWATTGRITGVPEGVSLDQPGSEPGPSSSQTTSAASPAGPISRKAREGSTEGIGDATEIKDQLRAGRSLDGAVRARMESAFGLSFSDVRVHTDHKAAQLSDGLKAHAFTIGQDIAFSAGAYRPGTLVGDALIAHELAHTVQQGGARPSAQAKQKEAAENGSLEHDADMSAVNAAVSLWAKGKSLLTNTARNVMPRLRSGLQLQRCSTDTCPSGYYWQLVNTTAIGSACDCTWRCQPVPSSGPTIDSANRTRSTPILPSPRHSVAATSALPGRPSTCLCLPLEDSEGNVISSPQMRGADQDYTGAAAAGAGMTQGPYRPPQTTDRRPPAADIRPAGGGGGGARPPAGGMPGGAPPVRPAAPPTQTPPVGPATQGATGTPAAPSAGGTLTPPVRPTAPPTQAPPGGQGPTQPPTRPGRPQNVLVVGAEREDEFSYAREVSSRGHQVTVVNPRVTDQSRAYTQRGGNFVEGRVEDLPRGASYDLIREDFPFPLGRVFPAAQQFAVGRTARLAPGGHWIVVTESSEFASTLQAAAERPGFRVRLTEVPVAHEATPQSGYARENRRFIVDVERTVPPQ